METDRQGDKDVKREKNKKNESVQCFKDQLFLKITLIPGVESNAAGGYGEAGGCKLKSPSIFHIIPFIE